MADQAVSCPDATAHTVHPARYVAHSMWADQMMRTHRQRRCAGCGLHAIWEPLDPDVLDAPAILDGVCSCGTPYDEGAPIRTDGQGGWLAPCCTEADRG